MGVLVSSSRICFLAATLVCALSLAGQTVPAKFADVAEASSAPVRVTRFDTPADDIPAVTDDVSDAPSADPTQPDALVPAPRPKEAAADRFQWKPALTQYGLEISIQHGWRFAHEPGTRSATGNGHWYSDWIHSIGETRGWDDEDGWHAGFVGHPLNGAIYGFIERQNDPLYRQVEWGDGRIYWMSLVRSLAFAAVGSTQWTLGPVSEASLGNVQLHASPGFIDLVTTPGLGVFVMMGEDMIDRYFIIPVENHTANPYLILVARALGNPSRSFANLMAFHQGWHRDTRPGIFGANHELRKELVKEYKEGLISAPFGPHTAEERAAMNQTVEKPPSKESTVELNAYAVYESFLGGGSCIGAGGQGAARVNPSLQIVSEVNGCLVINMPQYQSGDSTMFAVGPRWTPHAAHRFAPFAEVMFGGRRITHDITTPGLGEKLLTEWGLGEFPHFPKRSDYQTEYQQFGFAMTMGGGFDAAFGRAIAWRVLDVQYSRSWIAAVEPINAQQGVQIRSGIVLRFGTW